VPNSDKHVREVQSKITH